jgi:hypothetical protein
MLSLSLNRIYTRPFLVFSSYTLPATTCKALVSGTPSHVVELLLSQQFAPLFISYSLFKLVISTTALHPSSLFIAFMVLHASMHCWSVYAKMPVMSLFRMSLPTVAA